MDYTQRICGCLWIVHECKDVSGFYMHGPSIWIFRWMILFRGVGVEALSCHALRTPPTPLAWKMPCVRRKVGVLHPTGSPGKQRNNFSLQCLRGFDTGRAPGITFRIDSAVREGLLSFANSLKRLALIFTFIRSQIQVPEGAGDISKSLRR